MSDFDSILSQMESGDPSSAEKLLPLVYDELRRLAAQKLAQERSGQSLQATELVHEAYLKLVGTNRDRNWNGRWHFYLAAAESMRRILIDRARQKNRIKRGGGMQRVTLIEAEAVAEAPHDDLLALDEVLNRLAIKYPVHAKLVILRYFAGLSAAEATAALGLSRATSSRYWTFARAWLIQALDDLSK